MTVNLSTKRKQTHRQKEQTYDCQREEEKGRDGLGVWGRQMQTIVYRMDKQQGSNVYHIELCSISCDTP